ncbi:hypothetical protein [Thiothrix nivea]|uniref:hypothetical protein n=1 Tax=Thiothrix nivea TaxID=1031 RepID=UPI0002D28BF2|nr:hypothetical protein [Thiothrix nivea]
MEDKTIGLERTATLIEQARTQYPNNILLDDGKAYADIPNADNKTGKVNSGTTTGYVEPGPQVKTLMQAEHEATITYVSTPIASFFSQPGDTTAMELINRAQTDPRHDGQMRVYFPYRPQPSKCPCNAISTPPAPSFPPSITTSTRCNGSIGKKSTN